MKAMVLAAGAGTRLRPLTDTTPKALIEVGGVPMIEHVIGRLRAAGVTEVVLNLHHLGDRIVEFLESRGNFGLRIEYSREPELLDTGGGLKQAGWFFEDRNAGPARDPFFLHNVDVMSEINLARLLAFHLENGALATLAVHARPSARALLFDSEGRLVGRDSAEGREWASAGDAHCEPERLAFTGIHVISPAIFSRFAETGAFPITRAYLRLAAEGEKILACRVDGEAWHDIGSPERLSGARRITPG